MSIDEKLQTLEELWNDLCSTPAEVPSPTWHDDLLKTRQKRLNAEETHLLSWEDAKRRLRARRR